MLAKVEFDTLNTDGFQCQFGGKISDEQLNRMKYEEFYRTNHVIGNFANNLLYGTTSNNVRLNDGDVMKINAIDRTQIDTNSAEVNFSNIDAEKLDEFAQNGKHFILFMNINPNSLDIDGSDEISMWLNDSIRLLNDSKQDVPHRIAMLPTKNFYLDINDKKGVLCDCKIIEQMDKLKYRFSLKLLVDKFKYTD